MITPSSHQTTAEETMKTGPKAAPEGMPAVETREAVEETLISEIPAPPPELIQELAPAVAAEFSGEIAHLTNLAEAALPAITNTRNRADGILGNTVSLGRNPEQAAMQLLTWLIPLTASLVMPRLAYGANQGIEDWEGIKQVVSVFRYLSRAVSWGLEHWIISSIILVVIMTQVPIVGKLIQGILNVGWTAVTGLLKGTANLGMWAGGKTLRGAGKATKFGAKKGWELGGKGVKLLSGKAQKLLHDPDLKAFKDEVDTTLDGLFADWHKKNMTRAQMADAAKTLEDDLEKTTNDPRKIVLIRLAVAEFRERHDIQGVELDPESRRMESMFSHMF